MNNELFEQLLYEEESTTLDFKKAQYRFVKATDDEKSELLKDILGFSNAWRRSEAYILIGVEEIRGGRSNVVGISEAEQLDDHSLQQFVNNLTNQPVRFRYEAFGFEGKQVGIIIIEEQRRPLYLKRDYGKLVKEKVYIRRGSSTDPTKPALLEEIAQMRVSLHQSAAKLIVEFAAVKQDNALGTNISWDTEFCQMPDMIPDLERQRSRHPFNIGLDASQIDPINRLNEDFFRELAKFEFVRRLFRPLRLVVKNIGEVVANSVRVELAVPMNSSGMVLDRFEIPAPPKRYVGIFDNSTPAVTNPFFHHEPGDVLIDKNDERFRIEIDCGNLQPGRRVWSDIFYIGKGISGDLSLHGLVYADNLPQPQEFTLNVSVNVKRTSMTVEELCSLS